MFDKNVFESSALKAPYFWLNLSLQTKGSSYPQYDVLETWRVRYFGNPNRKKKQDTSILVLHQKF